MPGGAAKNPASAPGAASRNAAGQRQAPSVRIRVPLETLHRRIFKLAVSLLWGPSKSAACSPPGDPAGDLRGPSRPGERYGRPSCLPSRSRASAHHRRKQSVRRKPSSTGAWVEGDQHFAGINLCSRAGATWPRHAWGSPPHRPGGSPCRAVELHAKPERWRLLQLPAGPLATARPARTAIRLDRHGCGHHRARRAFLGPC